MIIKKEADFFKIQIGDNVEFHGDFFVVTGKGKHFGEPFIEISDCDVDEKTGVTTPIKNTEYTLLFSEAKNHLNAL